MSRGDYYDVWLRGETTPRRVQATRIGATVDIQMGYAEAVGRAAMNLPKEFIEVTEVDKADEAIRTFRFARSEVVVIEQGNEMLKTRKK